MPRSASGQSRNLIALYASVGPELYQYDVDVDGATLVKRGAVTLPANVHYAWPHASARYLYVASSNSASGMGPAGDRHHVTACRIDPGSGALTPHGDPIPLPTRPIHMTSDIPSEHLLVAFSNPSGLRVYRINADATPGAEVAQPEPIDPGIYAHQVRVSLDNGSVILVTRGHDAASGKPEEPGALKVFAYRQGLLTKEVSVAPNGGYGSARAISTSTRLGPGSTFHWSGKTSSIYSSPPGTRCRRHRSSAKTPWPSRAISGDGRLPAPFTCIRTGALSTQSIAPRQPRNSRASPSLLAEKTISRCIRSTRRPASRV